MKQVQIFQYNKHWSPDDLLTSLHSVLSQAYYINILLVYWNDMTDRALK